MGKDWVRTLQANDDVELVGLVDLNLGAAQAAVEEFGLRNVALGTSVSEVMAASGAHAAVNVTVPVAHHPVNVEAMFAGLPVLCAKSVAPTVAEGLSLAAAAEVSGQLLMISQSRRYFKGLTQLKSVVSGLGDIGVVTTEFFKAPHFGGFRRRWGMCCWWTWRSVSSMRCGSCWIRIRCQCIARSSIRRGAGTTALLPPPRFSPDPASHEEHIARALVEFVAALRSGEVPSGEVHSNVLSLAMVEAAVQSASTGQRMLVDHVVDARTR